MLHTSNSILITCSAAGIYVPQWKDTAE